jgi:DNA-binding NarL/FixJ family response regulator
MTSGDHAVLRVLIVDDHPMFRMGLSAALADMDGIELVGQAERAEEVEALVEATRPDVVLLDVRLPDGSGLEINRRLAEHHPQVKVILLTMSEDHDTVLTALRDGARGYLVKGTGPDRVEHALRAVGAGDVVLNQELARSVSELADARSRATRNRPFPALTDRQLDVLELIAQGWTTRRSPVASSSAPRQSATTSRTSSPRSTPTIAATPSSSPARPASGRDGLSQPLPSMLIGAHCSDDDERRRG